MKKIIFKTGFLLILVGIAVYAYIFVADKALKKYMGINTENQIRVSFAQAVADDYDTYLLGNSRIYRDINPDLLSDKSYNFAHDSDTYNQMYYKLVYLKNAGKKFNTLIMGTDYFQFSIHSDTRNYVYADLFDERYLDDYEAKSINDSLTEFIINKIQQPRIYVAKYILGRPVPWVFKLKTNGQFIGYATSNPNDFIRRSSNILDVQKKYFELIVGFCKENDINLYIIMPPVQDAELKSYTDEYKQKFDEMIKDLSADYAGNYYNFSMVAEFKDYKKYTDITHLNESAADECQ